MLHRFASTAVLFVVAISWVATPAPAAEPVAGDQEDIYELFTLLVDTIDQVERNYVDKIDRRELIEAAIKGVLQKLDPYSDYISPEKRENFQRSVENRFGGIGIQIGPRNRRLTVVSPMVGTPAYRAGLQAGDRIVEIEGETTDGLSIDDAVSRLKGEIGTDVNITIFRPSTRQRKQLTITRNVIRIETVLGDRRKEDDSWDYMLDHDHRIGYIRVTAFSRDTARALRKALQELNDSGMQGLVLDLRFNPGGLLSSAIEISDLFISEGHIVSTEGRNTRKRVWNAQAEGTFDGFPMALLVNRYSASSSEIVSACLQDHQRAVIVGERTWGKGSVQNVIPLEIDGNRTRSYLKLTTASYMRPSGHNINRFPGATDDDEWGVQPDDGFEVMFADDEVLRFDAFRRNRDIVRPHAEHSEQDPALDATSGKLQGHATPDAVAADGNEAAETAAAAFVDRQLKKAIEYVISKLPDRP